MNANVPIPQLIEANINVTLSHTGVNLGLADPLLIRTRFPYLEVDSYDLAQLVNQNDNAH